MYSRDVFDQSAEGGTITAWIYQGRVQKLSLHLFGDRGHYRNTYYLQGKWVFCVVKERWVYSHPISANTSRTLKMAKIKHEEYYLATGLGLYRPSPKSKLTKLTLSRRKAAERLLVQECAEASRIFKTHKSSTSSKKSVSSKHPTSRKKPITGKKSTSSKKTASKQR